MSLLIKNISQIVQTNRKNQKIVLPQHLNELDIINDGFILIKNDRIIHFGKMKNLKNINVEKNINILDADGGCVFPSFCDSHSHTVFSRYRNNEFVQRIDGFTYEEIAKSGGGILKSAKHLSEIDEDELYEKSLERIKRVIKTGTGALEIKSGYGLNLDAELKMLRVIKKIKENTNLKIKSSLLAAHAVPEKYKNKKNKYVEHIIKEIIPAAVEENLVDFIDVFCEKNFFSANDTEIILSTAKKYGLAPKIHVNQFNSIGGIEIAVKYNAISVDHLEVMSNQDIKTLSKSATVATLLPGCSFFLNIPYANAKKLISNDINICLASDFNPGSCPSGDMQFISSLACLKLALTPKQVINSTTLNGAFSMGISMEYGSIDTGKKANLFVTKRIPSYDYLHYSFNENIIKHIVLNGKVIN